MHGKTNEDCGRNPRDSSCHGSCYHFAVLVYVQNTVSLFSVIYVYCIVLNLVGTLCEQLLSSNLRQILRIIFFIGYKKIWKMISRLMAIVTTGDAIVKGGEVCMRPVWLPYQGQGFPRQTSEVKNPFPLVKQGCHLSVLPAYWSKRCADQPLGSSDYLGCS
jgi:hypothetical protein